MSSPYVYLHVEIRKIYFVCKTALYLDCGKWRQVKTCITIFLVFSDGSMTTKMPVWISWRGSSGEKRKVV